MNPYCVILFDDIKQAKTSTKQATNSPYWNESFFFPNISPHVSRLRILLFTQTKSSRDIDIGYVSVDLSKISLASSSNTSGPMGFKSEEWYAIKAFSRDVGGESSVGGKDSTGIKDSAGTKNGGSVVKEGMIRLSIKLTATPLLPMDYYLDFTTILLDGPESNGMELVRRVGGAPTTVREAFCLNVSRFIL
jgi:hypothetical protein